MIQSIKKEEKAQLRAENFTEMMELDLAINRHLHNNMGALSK